MTASQPLDQTNQDSESASAGSSAAETEHVSVMPNEIVQWVREINPTTIIDGTYGGGGHTRLLAEVLADAGSTVVTSKSLGLKTIRESSYFLAATKARPRRLTHWI